MRNVTTVLIAPSPGGEDTLRAASLRDVRQAASAAGTSLLWLLDSSAVASEGTLPALLDHAPGPAASLPVDRQGRPIEALMGRTTEADVPGILEAVARRRLPLRHTHVISLLVERDLVLELAPPDPGRFGRYAGPEWSGRLFARRRGVLVPGSRIVVDDHSAASPLHAIRAARSGKWGKRETLRELQRSVTDRLART